MASQDDLALLKRMYERGEISDEQYDTLRRHVLWGTPLSQLIDEPVTRSAAPGRDPRWTDRPPRDRRPAGRPWETAPPSRAGGLPPVQRRSGDRPWDTAPPSPAGGLPDRRTADGYWDADADAPVGGSAAGRSGRRRRAGEDRATEDRPGERWPPDGAPVPRGATRVEPAPGTARRRRRGPKLLVALTSMVLALALVAAGVWWFVLRDKGVDAPAYARTVCSSVRDWQQVLDARSTALVSSIAQQDDRSAVRSAVRTYYTDVADRTDGLRTALGNAGVAALPGGREYADSLAVAVGEEAAGLRDLAGRAERLDVTSPALFQTSLQGLLTGGDTAVSGVTAALARPEGGTPAPLRQALSSEPACAPYVG